MSAELVRLEDLVVGDISYGIVQPGGEVQGGTPILRVGDIETGVVNTRSPLNVAPSIAAGFQRTQLMGGEVLVTLVGTVGRIAIAPTRVAGWNVARAIAVLRPKPDIAADWLALSLSSPDVQGQISSLLNTTVQPTLNLKDLRAIWVRVPLERERRAIAEVLGALDDKIAANGKLGESVDELCQLRFSSMVGESLAYLRDIALVNREVVTPGQGSLRYLDIAGVGVGRYEWPEETEWADAPGRARRRVQSGDVVWSTVRPNRRSHALILDEDPLLVASTGLAILTPLGVGSAWLYEATRLPQFTDYLVATADGSAYPAVRAERFFEAPAPLADRVVMDAFECFAMPLRRRAHAATVESRELATLRDTLLPELMSGRLRVRDAERAVEDAL